MAYEEASHPSCSESAMPIIGEASPGHAKVSELPWLSLPQGMLCFSLLQDTLSPHTHHCSCGTNFMCTCRENWAGKTWNTYPLQVKCHRLALLHQARGLVLHQPQVSHLAAHRPQALHLALCLALRQPLAL